MGNAISLLFKPFYDKNFTQDYIKNGSGSGFLSLLILSVITTILIFSNLFLSAPVPVTKTAIKEIVSKGFEKIPPIVILDGNIVWEDDKVDSFIEMENLGSQYQEIKYLMTINTTDKYPSVFDVRKSILYFTKDTLYVNSGKKQESIALQEINNAFDNNYVDLTSEDIQDKISTIGVYFIWAMAIFALLFILGFILMGNIVITGITRFTAKTVLKKLNQLELGFFQRVSFVSTIPVIIVFDMIFYSFGMSKFLQWIGIIIISIVIMETIHLKDHIYPVEKEKTEDKENEEETIKKQ